MKIQEYSAGLPNSVQGEEAIKALNIGHKEVSGELLQLLDLDIKNRLKKALKHYQEYRDGPVAEHPWAMMEEFFLVDFDSIDKKSQDFEKYCDKLKEVEGELRIYELLDLREIVTPPEFDNGFAASLAHLDRLKNEKILSLSYVFEFIEDVNYIKIIERLPKGLECLNFCDDNLGFTSVAILKDIFEALPKNLKILSFENNYFNLMDKEDLVECLSLLPSGLRILLLEDNGLDEKYTKNDLNIPEHIKVNGLKDSDI